MELNEHVGPMFPNQNKNSNIDEEFSYDDLDLSIEEKVDFSQLKREVSTI